LGRKPSPATIKRWLLAEAAPHKNDDSKHNVEDREDGTTGNAEQCELADEFSRFLREFMEQLHRQQRKQHLAGRQLAPQLPHAKSFLSASAYPGAAMTDFEAMSYQGSRNRGNVLDDTEGDYDEE